MMIIPLLLSKIEMRMEKRKMSIEDTLSVRNERKEDSEKSEKVNIRR